MPFGEDKFLPCVVIIRTNMVLLTVLLRCISVMAFLLTMVD